MGDIYYRPLIEDMTFSHSRIKSYDACPYGWKLQYIDGHRDADQFYASFGSLMHDIIAKYYRGEITKSEMPAEFLSRFQTDVKGLRPSAKIVEKYISDGMRYLNNFSDFGLNTVAVELPVEFEINGIPMVGFIDYLGEKDGEYIIVDHKSRKLKPRSGRKTPTKSDKELDEYFRQLYLYSKPIYEKFGKYPQQLLLNCYRNDDILTIKESFNLERYEEALDWATKTIEAIKNDTEFEPKYDYFYCRWICGQLYNCETFEEEVLQN